MEEFDKKLLQYNLDVVHEDAYRLAIEDKQAFTLLRRVGLGASEASIYTGVNLWESTESLIEQKLSTIITPEEIAVGEKEVVRKGADLEPLILQKFMDWAGVELHKPKAMYRIKDEPQLTVNYDGVMLLEDVAIPVEAKYVSPYANKYWNRGCCIENIAQGSPKICAGAGLVDHINEEAKLYGIPPYYYTQLQQQLMGLKSPFGYFAALFDKGWELGVYKVYEDRYVQQEIRTLSKDIWNTITVKKKGGA